MKARNKILLLALCMAALIAVSVLGTMAYLTSTDKVTNTFTVGQVKITLDEAKVNTAGEKLYVPAGVTETDNFNNYTTTAEGNTIAKRVKGNEYKLLPGHTYTKDPTVTVLANSEESYVRMVVTATFDNALTDALIAENIDEIFQGYNSTEWNRTSKTVDDAKKVITYVYDYKTTVSAGADAQKLPALFTAIKIPGEWKNEQLAAVGNFKIDIVAEAIQKDGFDGAAAAWAAFNAQK